MSGLFDSFESFGSFESFDPLDFRPSRLSTLSTFDPLDFRPSTLDSRLYVRDDEGGAGGLALSPRAPMW